MKTPYLLDTSAFRALPSRIFQEHTFYASPYCFWELLTHLDEGSFDQHKGQLMKFKYAHILNDPRAEIEVPLLIDDNQLQDRVSDEELIAAALAALRDSNSLDMFYSSYVKIQKAICTNYLSVQRTDEKLWEKLSKNIQSLSKTL